MMKAALAHGPREQHYVMAEPPAPIPRSGRGLRKAALKKAREELTRQGKPPGSDQ